MSNRFNRWEYSLLDVSHDEDALPLLNTHGADGWELVAVDNGRYIFKRPAPDFRESITLNQRDAYNLDDEKDPE